MSRRSLGLVWLTSWLIFTLPAHAATTPSKEVQHALAPSGTLLVAVYKGSPTSIIEGKTPAENRGVGYDLGKRLAKALGVAFKPVVFPANDPLLAQMKAGTVDITFTNATAERAKILDFSQTYMDVEKSFLVPAGSALKSLADFNKPKLAVGVSQGSSTAEELRPLYPGLDLQTIATLAAARDMLSAHKLDAFATNKAILFQMSDALPGSHVIDGHWGMEHFGAGIPKGRLAGMAFLNAFIKRSEADGSVARAIKRAGLRGTVPAAASK